MRLGIALVASVLALLSISFAQLAAQDASPAATPPGAVSTGATPEVLDPTLCAVEPRTIENVQQILGTPAVEEATPAASPVALETPFVLPQGSSAEADAVDEVTATVRETLACLNAGDTLRYLALHTDTYVARLAVEGVLSQAQLDTFAAPPTPLDPAAQIGLIATEDIRMLADGRIAVLIRQAHPTEGPQRVFFVMAEQGGRYLIDEEILPEDPDEGVATPGA
ncbi:MAG: hypothetical protein M3Q03_10740 [Chloroflexota bacterium]|nr:hypothetical protein [Chloroflexota bacterium]